MISSYTTGITQFSDLTEQEFKDTYLSMFRMSSSTFQFIRSNRNQSLRQKHNFLYNSKTSACNKLNNIKKCSSQDTRRCQEPSGTAPLGSARTSLTTSTGWRRGLLLKLRTRDNVDHAGPLQPQSRLIMSKPVEISKNRDEGRLY